MSGVVVAATHPDVIVWRGGETYIACEAGEAVIDEASRWHYCGDRAHLDEGTRHAEPRNQCRSDERRRSSAGEPWCDGAVCGAEVSVRVDEHRPLHDIGECRAGTSTPGDY